MIPFQSLRVALVTFCATGAVALYSSCAPKNSNGSPSVPAPPPLATKAPDSGLGINSVPQSTHQCELKIRRLMQGKAIALKEVPGLEAEFALVNTALPDLKTIQYSVTESSEVTELDITHKDFAGSTYRELAYRLTVKDNGSSQAVLVLIADYVEASSGSSVEFTENFNVDKDCTLTLSSSGKTTIASADNLQWTVNEVHSFSDGMKQEESDHFNVPAHGILLNNNLPYLDSPRSLIPNQPYFIYISKVGLTSLDMVPAEDVILKEFGENFHFKGYTTSLKVKDRLFASMYLAQDVNSDTFFTKIAKIKAFIISRAIFESISLGTSRVTDSSVRSEIGKSYLANSNSFQLITSHLPNYDHFKAYFNMTEITQDSTTGLYKLRLTENPVPTIKDSATSEDLVSNDTIQTDLPEIQDAAKNILSTQPDDRRKQIELILHYLSTNYSYDENMLHNNIVRPLTTSEALSLKKGVCQHYAVIFTAIARALKIPTRIVMGYLLRDGLAGGHAWVESEVEPGLWQVIEPQKEDALSSTQTRYYFPVTRANFLENKQQNWTDIISLLLAQNLLFQEL